MPAFFEYLRNITYYLMFATVAGIFAPAGKYRKFVSLVLGFVLLLLMLQPLARFAREVPVTQWFAGLAGVGAQAPADWETAYVRWRDDYLRGAFEAQLEAQLRGLLAGAGFTVHSARFTYSSDFGEITSMRVSVSRQEEEPRRVPFIRIQPVQIAPREPEECPAAAAVKNLIAEFYNLPKAHIYVTVE